VSNHGTALQADSTTLRPGRSAAHETGREAVLKRGQVTHPGRGESDRMTAPSAVSGPHGPGCRAVRFLLAERMLIAFASRPLLMLWEPVGEPMSGVTRHQPAL
jgi:hypothetical protein